MGNYEKIIMEFEEVFWPADAPFIGCCAPEPPVPAAPRSSTPSASAPNGNSKGHGHGAALNSSAPALPSPCLSTPPAAPVASLPASEGVAVELDHGCEIRLLRAVAMPIPPAVVPTGAGTAPATAATAKSASTPVVVPSLVEPEPQAVSVPVPVSVSVAALVAEGAVHSVETRGGRQPESYFSTSMPLAPVAPAAPLFLENYLWSKGVPVLSAAVTGERARLITASAAAAAQAPAVGQEGADDGWRARHARDMYRRLVKPALDDAFGNKKEPVSVSITSWADEPCQRGSYSFMPIGARDDDYHFAGRGAAMGPPGADPGAVGSECVFIAGEATVPGYEGSMHGAYISGVRAVEDLMDAFHLPL